MTTDNSNHGNEKKTCTYTINLSQSAQIFVPGAKGAVFPGALLGCGAGGVVTMGWKLMG